MLRHRLRAHRAARTARSALPAQAKLAISTQEIMSGNATTAAFGFDAESTNNGATQRGPRLFSDLTNILAYIKTKGRHLRLRLSPRTAQNQQELDRLQDGILLDITASADDTFAAGQHLEGSASNTLVVASSGATTQKNMSEMTPSTALMATLNSEKSEAGDATPPATPGGSTGTHAIKEVLIKSTIQDTPPSGINLDGSSRYSQNSEGNKKGYRPPKSIVHQNEFTSSAVLVKCNGEPRSVKMFFDSLSSSSWASQRFVDSSGLTPHPILPEHLKEYNTVNGRSFIPEYYVEVELRDDSRGMKEFIKHSFNITPDMGGIGLVAGQPYLIEHQVAIDPSRRHDSFVTVAKEPSAAAKKAQEKLLERAAEERALARAIAASTVGSTVTPSSSPNKGPHGAVASSRTSMSSSSETKTYSLKH